MILVDTGPFVALFDPQDDAHERCKNILGTFRETLFTTTPVLTEVFHLLTPNSIGADRLRDFIVEDGLTIWFLDHDGLLRAFELMDQFRDHPMDLAEASIIVAAEAMSTTKVFTLDRGDFRTYRIRRGHRHVKVDIIG